MTTTLNSHEELAVKVVNSTEGHPGLYMPSVFMDQGKHFPIIFIGGWYAPKNRGVENSYFGGYRPWTTFITVDAVIMHIKEKFEENGKIWAEQFRNKFGDGYNDGFNHFDGSVGLGFELRSCGCFPEWLAISIVHMYYGK
jgi:hypothetical protein